MHYDVFNGDADGICALQQLRLAQPVECTLVTGVKRDISLLGRISPVSGDHVTVLDISLDKNRPALITALEAGAKVQYFDHHMAGDIPQHPALEAIIDTAAEVCTSLLVNQYLQGQHLPWAVVGAFGDNLYDSAMRAAAPLDLSHTQLNELRVLGTCINYNGYGNDLSDLLFHPADLFQALQPFADPWEFIHTQPVYRMLQQGYTDDLAHTQRLQAEFTDNAVALYILPDEKWARRISGVFANQLAREYPDRAHALLTEKGTGFQVSVRAPINNKAGADQLCSRFPGGGGRQGAAGINLLSAGQYDEFVAAFREVYAAG
ncbi:MAG: acetyltransferase [Gammaproteobacteria bacterium]|nr:acetyltransferase [Gammaproteobacteria bacterium]MDH5652366.1 acetyltransferase [Gammaproteobacteria bacterium]